MQLRADIRPDEPIGRFLPEKTYFSITKNSVLPKAFMPPPPDFRLSVFRIDNLSTVQIWELGQEKVINAMFQPKILFGVAKIKAKTINNSNLVIDPDNNPPRHANIIGWPIEKEKQKIKAMELAAEALLLLKE